MSSVWRQFTDPNLQLCLSVLIGLAALECLVAIWAWIAKVHWFWRALAVWGAVMLMVPIRAWELTGVFALTALLIVGTVQASRWIAGRLRSAAMGPPKAQRYSYSLRDLFLLVLLICLWLPGLVAAARNVHGVDWKGWLAGAACLAGLSVIGAKIAFGPQRVRAVVLLVVALPLGAVAVFATVSRMQVWMITGGSGTYAQELAGLIVVELEFVLVVAVVTALACVSHTPLRSHAQRTISATALTALAAVWTVWLGWIYVQLLERPSPIAKFELPNNHYAKILEIARRVNAINPGNASIASLRSTPPKSTAAQELEALYEELFPLLAGENAVPYDPQRDGTLEYMQAAISDVQVLRGLCRSLQAESESALINRQPGLAADYAIACLELSETHGRGGGAIHALVGRALEGVAYAQLAKLREQLSPSKRREAIAALARDQGTREDMSVLRARELVYGERAIGFLARLENTFLKLAGRKPPWEEALGEAARRQGAMNSMLQADFAVRLFEEDHGRLPHSLEELVPAYLPTVPLDSFSGKLLCYKLEGDRLTVYSVGRDAEDNGGNFGTVRTYYSFASGYDFDLDTLTRK